MLVEPLLVVRRVFREQISVLHRRLLAIVHEFEVNPGRMVDQLCERADVLEMDTTNEDVRTALDEMTRICRDRRPIRD